MKNANCKMIKVLTNPNKFFEERIREENSLKIPVLILLISGIIIGGTVTFIAISTVQQVLPLEIRSQLVRSIVFEVGTRISFVFTIFAFVGWLVVAAIFFSISCIFKGEGKFKRTLEFVGYGFIPMIFGVIINMIIIYYFFSTMQIQQVTDPSKIAEVITEAVVPVLKSPTIIRLFSMVGIFFTLWSANIWVFGLKHARNLSTKNALITVGIPVTAHILYLIWKMGIM